MVVRAAAANGDGNLIYIITIPLHCSGFPCRLLTEVHINDHISWSHLFSCRVSSSQQSFAHLDTLQRALAASLHFALQTLVIIHQHLYWGHVPAGPTEHTDTLSSAQLSATQTHQRLLSVELECCSEKHLIKSLEGIFYGVVDHHCTFKVKNNCQNWVNIAADAVNCFKEPCSDHKIH